jgi:hypothetical protein
MTEAVMQLASIKLDLRNQLDNDMFNHIVFVSNQCLMTAKKQGINKGSLEIIGKYLWRLFNVLMAYNSKRRDVTLNEIISIVGEFKSVFAGT